MEDETKVEKIVSTCAWNKTWVPDKLPPCAATSCQVIPFPPDDTGMIYKVDPENPLTFKSEYAIYSPRLPFTMNFPGPGFCSEKGDVMMVVGTTPRVRYNQNKNNLEDISEFLKVQFRQLTFKR